MTLVLVHGGWHGGWCWEMVRPLLKAAGHTVVTPSLVGLAERAGELTPGVDLEAHIAEVVAIVDGVGESDITLVGHSYGGMVVTGVADRRTRRVRRLVYLDAFVPEDGQSVFDLLPPSRRDHLLGSAVDSERGRVIPPPAPASFGVTEPTLADDVRGRLTAQPLATLTQAIRFEGRGGADLPRLYIHCTGGPLAPSFAPFADRFDGLRGWEVVRIDTGHDAMLTEPRRIADLILRRLLLNPL